MRKIFTKAAMLLTSGLMLVALINSNAQFVVTTTADSGPGSLRAALISANTTAGHDIITFNLTGGGPNAVYTIAPLTQLPPLLDNAGTTIDGFSQPDGTGGGGTATPGANPPSTAVLYIELAGTSIQGTPANGIVVASDSNVVQGLIVNRFGEDGIRIESGGALEPSANHNRIFCNYVGTDATGTIDFGNGVLMASLTAGITVKNVMGGVTLHNELHSNLSSGNFAEGIQVVGPIQPGDVGFTDIIGNYVGTDAQGLAPIPNDREGVLLVEGTHDNLVDSNLISANLWDGVGVVGFNNVQFDTSAIYTQFNIISNNIIGLDINLQPLGNGKCGVSLGIYGFGGNFGYAYHNDVINNIIARNGDDGVVVWEDPTPGPFAAPTANADENLISQNSIYNNLGLGIDLDDDVVTLNDPLDPDVGANQQLNFPVIASAVVSGGIATIMGSVDMPSPAAGMVEVYIANVDPSGHGEGQIFMGAAVPNAAGIWTVTTNKPLTPNDILTAISIDQSNNTSEFSQNYMGVILPIRLVSFGAEAFDTQVELNWKVASAAENLVYEVQRASDELTFEYIGKVSGARDDVRTEYTFIDSDIERNAVYYYRLKILSENGEYDYSPVARVVVSAFEYASFYPNPTTGLLDVQFEVFEECEVVISIVDSGGRVVRKVNVDANKGITSITLDMQDIGPGTYSVMITAGDSREIEQVVVQ